MASISDFDRLDENIPPPLSLEAEDFAGGEFETPQYLAEGDEFLGKLIKRVGGLVRHATPILRKLAPVAVKAVAGAVPGLNIATSLLGEEPSRYADRFNDPFDGECFDGECFDGEEEDEDEAFSFDGETGLLGEAEDEASIMAEALLSEAARVATDTEAAALAGGITITITSNGPVSVRRVAPTLARATTNLVRTLRRTPATRPLVPVAGAIARSAARTLARRAAQGKPVTPKLAAQVMAQKTRSTLAKPSRVAKALVRNAVQTRKLNQSAIRRAEG